MAQSETQKFLAESRKRRARFLARRDKAKSKREDAEEAKRKEKERRRANLKKTQGSLAEQQAAIQLGDNENRKGRQTAIPASKAQTGRLGTVATVAALNALPVGKAIQGITFLGKKGWQVGNKIYKTAAAARKAKLAQGKTPPVRSSKTTPSASTQARNRVVNTPNTSTPRASVSQTRTPSSAMDAQRAKAAKDAKRKAEAAEAKRKAEEAKAAPTPTPKASPKPKPKPKASPKPKPKPKVPPKAKTQGTPKNKLREAVNNPLLPAAIGLTSVANLPDKKKPMPPIKEKGYVKTIPKPKSTKLPSSAGIDTDDFSEEKESYKGLYDKKENTSKKSNARKKKDKTQGGRFKHYDSDFARKYDIMYRTNKDPDWGIAGPKSEEDISGGYTGGQVKKLKKGGRPSRNGKSGFRGKGAGCAKRGY